jgi:hypothetical protein
MRYRLVRLAAGSYDVLLNGIIIAGLVRVGRYEQTPWVVELLVDLPPGEQPEPFSEAEHRFATFEEARSWLGIPDNPTGASGDETS